MKQVVVVFVALAVSAGCTHAVSITSTPPGADIYIDNKKVGTTPMTYTEETAGSGQVMVTAKANGKEKKVTVPRNNLAMMPLLAGAGAGAGGCLVFGAASGVCGALTGVGLFGLCVAPLFIPAGAGAAWFLYGNQMPDTVAIDMKDAVPSTEVPAGAAHPSASY
jgi:hypothetical protein